MSDADGADDDAGFDKEAERERLREKYERDRAGREQTQRMSELLLQGATMTNSHCDECGNPVFRYDGQEFCPICDQPGEEGGTENTAGEVAAAGETDAGATGDDAGGAGANAAEATETADATGATDATGVTDTVGAAGATEPANVPGENATTGPASGDADARARAGDDDDAGRQTTSRDAAGGETGGPTEQPAADRAQPAPTGAGRGANGAGENVATARASLARTLAAVAREAEAADDPRRVRELLETAREAAEALAAVDRIR